MGFRKKDRNDAEGGACTWRGVVRAGPDPQQEDFIHLHSLGQGRS